MASVSTPSSTSAELHFNLRARIAQRFSRAATVLMLGETAIGPYETMRLFCEKVINPTNAGNGYAWIDICGTNGLDGQFDFPTHNRVLGDGLVTDSAAFKTVEEAIAAANNYRPSDINVSFIGTGFSRVASQRLAMPSGTTAGATFPERPTPTPQLSSASSRLHDRFHRTRRALPLTATSGNSRRPRSRQPAQHELCRRAGWPACGSSTQARRHRP
jgi:hypothetical protein